MTSDSLVIIGSDDGSLPEKPSHCLNKYSLAPDVFWYSPESQAHQKTQGVNNWDGFENNTFNLQQHMQ